MCRLCLPTCVQLQQNELVSAVVKLKPFRLYISDAKWSRNNKSSALFVRLLFWYSYSITIKQDRHTNTRQDSDYLRHIFTVCCKSLELTRTMLSVHQIIKIVYTLADTKYMLKRSSYSAAKKHCWIKSQFNLSKNGKHDYVHSDNK